MGTRRPPSASVDEGDVRPLSTDCTVIDGLRPTERLLFGGGTLCAGTFTCRPADPLFHRESPSTAHCIVFSRTSVWIRHEGGSRYVADPTVVTFHNRGRVYQRWRIADAGDRCDWLAYADEVVAEAVQQSVVRRARRDPLWFPAEFARISSGLYARQRRLFDRISAASVDAIAIEEEAMRLLDEAIAATGPMSARPLQHRRDVDAVQHVRAVIAADPVEVASLRILAGQVEMTSFHLCRAFRRVFGETMTSYRLRLRLLASLEHLRRGEAITDIALAHGFSSHSHYTAAFRQSFGTTPAAWRNARQ